MSASEHPSTSTVDFSFSLYRACSSDKGSENVLVSPSNIAMALGMTLAGARNDTASQILAGLGLGHLKPSDVHESFKKLLSGLQKEERSVTLHAANRLFVQKGMNVLDEFADTLRTAYSSSGGEVDFAGDPSLARAAINDWVSNVTKEKIKDLIPEGFITPSTTLIISSAVYFKGLWESKFNPSLNKVLPFHVSLDRQYDVDMMFQKKKFLAGTDKELCCKALLLPYVGEDVSMLVLLPDDIDGLEALAASLNDSTFRRLLGGMEELKVSVWLPKFRIDESLSLKDKLQAMGIHDLFDQLKADLSGITGSRSLYVGAALHKAFMEVNEEGTEAAAATAMRVNKRCAIMEEEVEFKADRPFLFAVLERKHDLILFIGALKKPALHGNAGQREEL